MTVKNKNQKKPENWVKDFPKGKGGRSSDICEISDKQVLEVYKDLETLMPFLKQLDLPYERDWRNELAEIMYISKPQLSSIVNFNIRNNIYRVDFVKHGKYLYKKLLKKQQKYFDKKNRP